ncbi:MAG TPA: osmotically inducible protein OsmC [Thermoplasmatales archaeon]|nr:osmotically inducible protein OsmC [Thermoplasmatales archaeon]
MMTITFPGGKKVEARYKGITIQTDQPVSEGGGGTAPAPFDLFIASIGTCMGYYVLQFCEQRDISCKDIRLSLTDEWDPIVRRIIRIKVTIELPSSFPSKYSDAVIKAAEQCTVKKHLLTPPEIVVETKQR